MLPQREIEICSRLREVRLDWKWGMPDFVKPLGISRDRLASYEYARAPLRYDLARLVCEHYSVNPQWLATGTGPRESDYPLPIAVAIGASPDRLFSEIYDEFVAGKVNDAPESIAAEEPLLAKEPYGYTVKGRQNAIAFLQGVVSRVLRGIPNSSVKIFKRDFQAAVRVALQGQKDNWAEELRRLVAFDSLAAKASIQKDSLTGNPVVSIVAPTVKKEIPTWPELREELKKLTSERGAKAALARQIGVTPQAVSDWLREVYSPEADTVLWLLRWVENPQPLIDEQKNSGTVTAAPESKTQSKGKYGNTSKRSRPGKQ